MTPVHDQSYRRYEGGRRPIGQGWTVIATAGIRAFLARRVLLALLGVAWLPFLVRCVQIYLLAAYPEQLNALAMTPATFVRFVEFQGIFAFFVTVYVGAGLIANDHRANALPLYLSKPIRRIDYVAGKLAVLMTFVGAVTVLPSVLLLVMLVVLSGSIEFLRAHGFVVAAVVVAASLRVIVAAISMLALSALSTSARYVAILYTGVVFFSGAMYLVLRLATGTTRVVWVSVTGNFAVIDDALFREAPRYDVPVVVSVLILTGIVAVSISVLERRVRGVEVVS